MGQTLTILNEISAQSGNGKASTTTRDRARRPKANVESSRSSVRRTRSNAAAPGDLGQRGSGERTRRPLRRMGGNLSTLSRGDAWTRDRRSRSWSPRSQMKRRNAEVSILTARASHSTARSNSLERRTNHRPAKSTSRAGGERSKARPRRPPKPPESIRDTKERNTGPTSKYKKPNRYRAPIPSYLTGETDDEHQDQNSVPAKDCIVCTNTRSLHHFPTRPPTSQCTHKANICRRCLKGWIKSEFERKVWNQINCPECAARIEYDDMLEFAPRNIFHRYDKLSTKAALEAIPGFQWCPAQNCTSGQIHGDSETNPKFECLGCKYTHCLIHNVPWHRKETCAQYDYRRTDSKVRRAEEEASAKVIKATAKKCPGCKAWIQKHYGCDHMTCSKCKHEFCWLCLADWAPVSNQGPSSHRPNCALYMDR